MDNFDRKETKFATILSSLSSKIFVLVSLGTFCALAGIYFFIFFKGELTIFPSNEKIKIDFYNDSLDQGNSKFLKRNISKNCISTNFMLKEGFLRPYIGIGFEEKLSRNIDISDYNTVEIKMNSSNITPFFAYFVVRDSLFNTKSEFLDRKFLCHFFEVTKQLKTYSLPISDFKIPDWWYDKCNISPNSITQTNLKKLFRITITTGLTPSINQECSLKIYSLRFFRDNTLVIITLVLIQFCIMLTILIFNFYKFREKPKSSITISYKAVMPDEELNLNKSQNSYLEYIHSNFNDANLTLEILAEKCSINKRIIAETISGKYQCNFKTYINQIRISEAKRLLVESNLNISEIAYKVGFNSPNNFNRVFKKICGVSPREYRESKGF